MIFEISPAFNFDPHDLETQRKYELPNWEYSTFKHLNGRQEWIYYLEETYQYRYPSTEISRLNTDLNHIPIINGTQTLYMPEPFSFYGIKDLVLSTDMPITPSMNVFSKKIIDLLDNRGVSFLSIPTRVYLFDVYPSHPRYSDEMLKWENIKKKCPATENFIALKLLEQPVNIFEDDSLERKGFLFAHKDENNIKFREGINFDTLPLFFRIPTSNMIHVTLKTKILLEEIASGIWFKKVG
jgi:hypothetical protein